MREPNQLRLWPVAIFFYLNELTTHASRTVAHWLGWASYWHRQVVCLDRWDGIWALIRIEAAVRGVDLILCQTIQEAINMADMVVAAGGIDGYRIHRKRLRVV